MLDIREIGIASIVIKNLEERFEIEPWLLGSRSNSWKRRPETCPVPVKGKFQHERRAQRVQAPKRALNIHTLESWDLSTDSKKT